MADILQDKKSIFHVLAGLMDDPKKLNDTRNYRLTIEDFPESFHRIIFGIIHNLNAQGIENISAFEVDNALSEFPKMYKIYNDANGLDYVEKIEQLGEPENFELHYNRVKKHSLLRSCQKKGINISDIYDQGVLDVRDSEEQQERFNIMSLHEMVSHIEAKVIEIRDEFLFDSDNKGSHMGDNLLEIMQEKFERPSYGAGFSSGLFTAATRGARLKKVYMNSAPSGVGKSRFAISSMLAICVPEIYDKETDTWIQTGATGRGLYVGTELEEDEVKIPAICYIADVEEEKIQEASLTEEEKERLLKAIDILKRTPFWFEQLHDFDLADIEHVIVKHINKNDVQYVA